MIRNIPKSGFFLCVFEKLKGQKSSPFWKLKAQNSRSFPMSQCTGGLSVRFLEKTLFLENFVCKTSKLCWKLPHFDVKNHFLWLKINIYHWNLAIFMSKLKYFPQNSPFFQTEGKNSRKIQNSKQKLIKNSKLKAKTQRFWRKNSRCRKFLPLMPTGKSHKKSLH